ncbi:MAG: 4-hydroxyphenylacetate 3-hydroxylase N-terminal domain-containing protein [Candidatus Binatia bacterium]
MRFAAKAADEDLYVSYVIVQPTIDRAKPAHQQAEPCLYAGVAAERDNGIVIRGAQMLGTGSVMSDYVLVTVILPLKPGGGYRALRALAASGGAASSASAVGHSIAFKLNSSDAKAGFPICPASQRVHHASV